MAEESGFFFSRAGESQRRVLTISCRSRNRISDHSRTPTILVRLHDTLRNSVRIAYLVSQYPAVNHTFILREIRGLRAQGFRIDIVSVRHPDRPASAMTAEEREECDYTRAIKGISILGAVGAQVSTFLSRPVRYLRGLKMAVRMGRGSVPATVAHLSYFAQAVIAGRWMLAKGYAHFHTHFSSTVGLLVTHVFPLTMSITIHGPDEFNDVVGFHMTEKVAASRLVVAISSYARSQILRYCPPTQWDRVVTCRLGVDGAIFDPRLEPHDRIPEILCVARLAPVKAQYMLIAALRLLRDRGITAKLRLVGDGPDRPLLEAAAERMELSDDVIFDGWRNQDEVRALYRQATLFAMASFAEGIPVVLMEAMAMEIPCVAPRIMGIPELIEDGVSGLLVPPADEKPLADVLERLLQDSELRAELGPAGRRRVLEQFSLSTSCATLGKLFEQRLH